MIETEISKVRSIAAVASVVLFGEERGERSALNVQQYGSYHQCRLTD